MFLGFELSLIFAGLLGLSILIYVVLDGFDLGVGLLFPFASAEERDTMVASIGPFWDANETWLVLAIGILLVAFPIAHGVILTQLYLPVAIMLIGLILRGVAFEFRAKAPPAHKRAWDFAFFSGSLMAALSQGFMLGLYIMGLKYNWWHVGFALVTAAFLTVAYSFIGATWLLAKTDGELQHKAAHWSRGGIWGVVLGLAAISIATPLVSPRIYEKWFHLPEMLYLSPLPVVSAALIALISWRLVRFDEEGDRLAWLPFVATILLFALGFAGMAYSFYPFIVPDALTIQEAASAPESLSIILVGTLVVLPTIIAYSALSYWIFRGKAKTLSYD
ncbi:cytochrome d ubiquinol oxidase subunit II [Aestuariivirga sp.]|uniref:cytochrome d ubiquinol oxidase subunit II n=1 Tax=Aestuariivirga sp. TaxID=2650926 RepID=UPI0039E7115F